MNKEQKAAVVDEVAAQIEQSEAIFVVDYRGISVPQAAELRRRLGDADATLRIVKNTLTRRAVERTGAQGLEDVLDGPTAFTFVRGDAALAAKALATFRREAGVVAFKGGSMEGAALSVEQVESISRLPAQDALQGQFVGVLASPLTGLVRGLGSMIQGLALQLGQIQEQGLVSGEAPRDVEPRAAETPAAGEADAGEADADVPAADSEPAADEAAAETESTEVQPETEAPSEGDEEEG